MLCLILPLEQVIRNTEYIPCWRILPSLISPAPRRGKSQMIRDGTSYPDRIPQDSTLVSHLLCIATPEKVLQPEQSAHRISQVADEGREAKGRGMIGAQEDRVEGDRRDTVENSCRENAKSYVFVAIVHHRDWCYSTL